jgi:hypothetical protein
VQEHSQRAVGSTQYTPADDAPDDLTSSVAAGTMRALAIHISADRSSESLDEHWPRAAAQDTVRRAAQICRRAGIAEQRTLAADRASTAAVLAALREAAEALTRDGLLVLTFAGATLRGDGPLETTQWQLYDGGLTLTHLADQLAMLPATARLIIIADTCHASAIAGCLHGSQLAVVIAGCGEDQKMMERRNGELVIELEQLLCGPENRGSLRELRHHLEADAPDDERPTIWTNVADWWSASALDIFANIA